MRKLLLALLCLLPLLSQADDFIIDETKSDIYFANSILMTKDKTKLYLRKIITENVLQEQYNSNSTKMEKELNFDINYNQTHGYYGDWYDTYMMLSSEEDGWKTLNKIMSFVFDKSLGKGADKLAKVAKMTKQEKDLLDKFLDGVDLSNMLDRFKDVRDVDLSRQVAKLRDSIRHGHGVIVLAHGKGDIFTAKAYEEMLKPDSLDGTNYRDNGWLKEYFQWMSIGSPSRDRAKVQSHVGFDNDSLAALGLLSTIKNPNRSQFENGAREVVDENEIEFHNFKYYMGVPVHIVDGYKDTDVSTDIAKVTIMNFIKGAIGKHKTAQSQWVVDEEFKKDTKDYRVTLKHFYGDLPLNNMMKDEKVFPFNPKNGKLYQVKDPDESLTYVKASLGGEKILDEWEEQDERQFYKLEGTDPIEYIVDENKSLPYDMYKFVVFEQFSVMNFQATKVVIIIYGFKNGKKKRIYGKEVPFKKVEGTATFDWSYGYIYDRIFYLHTSSPGIIFFETKDIDDLRSKLMEEWNLKLRYYIYAVGVGNGSLPDAIAEVSFKFENNAIDMIMENK
jgi:hypothetical protein